MLLAPRRSEAYAVLSYLHSYTDNVDGLGVVWRKLQTVEVDREQYDRDTLDYFAGRKDDKTRDDLQKSIARRETTLEAARKVKGATLAVAAADLAGSLISKAALGLDVDADAVIRLAEEANAAAPSAATRNMLMYALCFRASVTARKESAYGALARKTARSLGQELLTYILAHEGPLRDKALANVDVKRAITLRQEQNKAFPGHPSPSAQVFLRAASADDAVPVVEAPSTDKGEEIKAQDRCDAVAAERSCGPGGILVVAPGRQENAGGRGAGAGGKTRSAAAVMGSTGEPSPVRGRVSRGVSGEPSPVRKVARRSAAGLPVSLLANPASRAA